MQQTAWDYWPEQYGLGLADDVVLGVRAGVVNQEVSDVLRLETHDPCLDQFLQGHLGTADRDGVRVGQHIEMGLV